MEANNETDFILQNLLALGFEYEACKNVIDSGIRDIQSAVERLLIEQDDSSQKQNADDRGQVAANNKPYEKNGISEHNLVSNDVEIKSHRTSSEQQGKSRDKYEKQKHEAQAAYQKRRMEDKCAKRKILEQIEQDKKSRKEIQPPSKSSFADVHTKATTSKKLKDENDSNRCTLLFRLPEGVSKKHSFHRGCSLMVVREVLYDQNDLQRDEHYQMIQPFPRKIFTKEDMDRSLDELKLYPSATIILQKCKLDKLEDVEKVGKPTDSASEASSCTEMKVESTSNSGSDSADEQGNAKLYQEAVERRLNQTATVEGARKESEEKENVLIRRLIPSLQNICAKCVATQLIHLNSATVSSMHRVPNKAANQIIRVLKERKELNGKTIDLFRPCKLTELQMDFYVLCTNDVLERLKWHGTISKLSLVSSKFITDRSVKVALAGLPLLEYLNLTDCSKLTGGILEIFKGLKKLRVLIVDKVKIDDNSLSSYLLSSSSDSLVQLSLNYCPISGKAFQEIKTKERITNLSLNYTKIATLSFISEFPRLHSLNLKNLPITNEEIAHVEILKKLKILELTNTKVTSDGLKYVTVLPLKRLGLPNRLTVDDDTIAVVKHLPLTSLDLSDHIKITDIATAHIGQITSLLNLSLSNTKITDESIKALAVLENLESLDVSKCNISNSIGSTLKSFTSLHTLNLSATNIDDDIIGYLASCQNLCKLNLIRTSLTNTSMGKLKLRFLTTLLLDQTEVTWDGVQLCMQNCPRLTMVRNSKHKVLISSG